MSYVTNRGVRIHYEVEGEGVPLVLHHGFSDSLEGWREYGYVDALREQYRLILMDGRGHGASDKPHAPEAYGLETRAGDVTAVLDDLGIKRAHYFGYSMGAWIGFGLALHAPERLHALILGGAQPYGQSMALFRQGLSHGIEGWGAVVLQMATPYLPNITRFLRNDVRALYAAVAEDRPDISQRLSEITLPCLLFAGRDDPLHALIERCSKELPNASFFSVPALNHFQTLLRSDLVLPHIDRFLTQAMMGRGQQLPRLVR